jgi:hypothetical protein
VGATLWRSIMRLWYRILRRAGMTAMSACAQT